MCRYLFNLSSSACSVLEILNISPVRLLRVCSFERWLWVDIFPVISFVIELL